MSDTREVPKDGIGTKLRRQFIAGILVIVPIGASILILRWLFSAIDSILQPVEKAIWHQSFLGVGFAATIIIIYLAGVIATNVVGKRLVRWGESLLARVPIFRPLYTGMKQILESFASPDKAGFMNVVLVEFPRKGMRVIGFTTNEMIDKSGKKILSVFIPHVPNPTTGFLQIVREEEVVPAGISVEEAVKMVVSAGRMTPEGVGDHLPEQG